jgi:hypothetical protein
MGCYTVQPIAGQNLAMGSVVLLGINDQGRATLGGQMGPEIREIEGRLLEKDSAAYTVAVQQIRTLSGGTQVWSGERIRVSTEYVSSVREKHFSRGKTAIVGAAVAGLIIGVWKGGLIGGAQGDEGQVPPDTGITIRYPRYGR